MPEPHFDSRRVQSNQQGLHQNLEKVVMHHLGTEFKRPFAAHNVQAFDTMQERYAKHGGALIIDSYCGVGQSTVRIAKENPEALVIGIDKSLHRLGKHEGNYTDQRINNYLIIRADVDDVWRLAQQAGWKPTAHYLLYPNPWPKSSHLKRRCHGSPLFPTLLSLGGNIELRSNWRIYVEEFAKALEIAGFTPQICQYSPDIPTTPFEQKYKLSNQDLWRCQCSVK